MNRCEVVFCNMIAVFWEKKCANYKGAKNDEKLDKYPNIIN